jgi:Family of unknown function (DUF5985)
MTNFLPGLLTAGFLVAALFFVKFYARTRDPLFIAFAVAFALFASEQALVGIWSLGSEDRTWIYLLRFAGFILIIIGVLAKNRGPAKQP